MSSTLFSRIILIVSGIAVLVLVYWFITTAFSPVIVPPAPPRRTDIKFDPTADVSKNETFTHLRLLADPKVTVEDMGRLNPFSLPQPPAPIPTSTIGFVTTSTMATTIPVVSSTSPIMPAPIAPIPSATSTP